MILVIFFFSLFLEDFLMLFLDFFFVIVFHGLENLVVSVFNFHLVSLLSRNSRLAVTSLCLWCKGVTAVALCSSF